MNAVAGCDIQIEGVKKYFRNQRALRGVSMTIEAGTFLVVLGPNGAGKSTLLNILASLTRPTEGSVRLGGETLKDDPQGYRRQIGQVSHHSLLYENLSAEENLIYYARMYGIANPQKRIAQMLHEVGLTGREVTLAREMSRGMVQRLAIARALLHDPGVVLLDEPYTGLDIAAAERFNELLAQLKAAGRTIVLTTHNIRQGVPLADRIMILVKGRIAFDKPAAGLDAVEVERTYGYWSEMFPT